MLQRMKGGFEYSKIRSRARKQGSKMIRATFCFALLVCFVGVGIEEALALAKTRSQDNLAAPSSRRNVNNCSAVPMYADLAVWRASCIGSESLTGSPYLECLQYWHKDAVACESMDGMCSLKAHCSDMSSYPRMGLSGFGGGVALYIVGVLYMFVALAIVCDDYFVPALEVIIDKRYSHGCWWISSRVLYVADRSFHRQDGGWLQVRKRGALLELLSPSLSTIVGSAVFNVLFVIAACALVSKVRFEDDKVKTSDNRTLQTELELTSWPLTRDSTYYCITLLVLSLFYQASSFKEAGDVMMAMTVWIRREENRMVGGEDKTMLLVLAETMLRLLSCFYCTQDTFSS
eukprot:749948-Hanusia_phi.AAC.3